MLKKANSYRVWTYKTYLFGCGREKITYILVDVAG